MNPIHTAKKIAHFYLDGFRSMRLGKTLWSIIAIKLLIFFVVIKWLFFPNHLNENFATDQERSEHVVENLTGE